MELTIAERLTVTGMPAAIREQSRRELTLTNPEYESRRRGGRWIPPGMAETVSLYDEAAGGVVVLPMGYMERVAELAKGARVPVEFVDRRLRLEPAAMTFSGGLRPYQVRALGELCRHSCGLLEAPCGSGKTVMAMALAARKRQPTLLLAHTKDLARQLADAAREWLGVEPGMCGAGEWRPGEAVTVALVQALTARRYALEELAERVGCVILDEAHHAPAATFTEVMQAFPAAYRYGVTATPDRRDGLAAFMTAVIGPIRARVTREELEAAGVSVRPVVEWIPTRFFFDYREESQYQAMLSAMAEDPARNELLVTVARGAMDGGRQVLILTDRVAHAEALAEALGDDAAALHGGVSKRRRAEILAAARGGRLMAMVATKLADEGLDVPSLGAVILAAPARDPNRVVQRIGRTLRPMPGKPAPVVYDVVDRRIPLLVSQARTRFFCVYRQLAERPGLPEWLKTA